MKGLIKNTRSFLEFPIIYNSFIGMISKKNKIKTITEKYIRARVGDRLLDIGCGPAHILEQLPDVEYLGFDLNKKYIEAATKKFGRRGRFICEKISKDAVRGEATFDIVLAKDVLHHLNDKEAGQLFELARKAMKPSGRLITIDGCYVEGRSKLEHFILSMDRGKYVRTQEPYFALASKVFPNIRTELSHDLLRVPYTHIIMECSL